ncbi:MAG: BrnA antitoxin family protein [Opitutales bacterium]|nr:BrnA antitoxin family protein [Opitutales bacterium]
MAKKKGTITAEEFDKKFDDGEDISEHLDWSKAVRPNLDQKRVNLDLPIWMIQSLDSEAKKVGVTRQSIMKVWLSERIKVEQGVSRNSETLRAS